MTLMVLTLRHMRPDGVLRWLLTALARRLHQATCQHEMWEARENKGARRRLFLRCWKCQKTSPGWVIG